MTPEKLARMFHERYERLAPAFGYKTRDASAVPWDRVPEQNRNLMTAVCADILASYDVQPLKIEDGLDEIRKWRLTEDEVNKLLE